MHLRRILHSRLLLQLHQLQCQKKQRLVKFMLANVQPLEEESITEWIRYNSMTAGMLCQQCSRTYKERMRMY